MKNRGKKLLTGLALMASLAGGVKNANAQQIVVNPYSPVNENGKELLDMNIKYQRDSLIQDFLDVDWNDVAHIPPRVEPEYSGDEIYDCTQYTSVGLTNQNDWGENINLYNGYDGFDLEKIYENKGTLKDEGVGGLPFMSVYITSPGLQDHEQLAMLTGDSLKGDLKIWENWNFIEPQYDAINVQPGEYFMPENCEVVIKYNYVNQHDGLLDNVPIVKFNVTNSIPEFTWMNDDPNLKIYTTRPIVDTSDKTPPEINLENPVLDSVYVDNVFLKCKLTDENLDLENSYYMLNGVKNYFSDSTETVHLDSKKGTNKLEIFATDKFGNDSYEVVNYNYVPDSSTSSDKNKNLEKILSVYPNPNEGNFNIKYNSKNYGKIHTELYSVDGKLIDHDNYEVFSGDNLINVDMSDKPRGVYLLNITSDGKSKTEKIVVR